MTCILSKIVSYVINSEKEKFIGRPTSLRFMHLGEHLQETCAIEVNRDVTDKI